VRSDRPLEPDEPSRPEVLVVDDDRDTREAIRETLVEEGYTVSCAGNGREAMTMLESTLPDLLVLDLMMPELNGWQVLALLGERRLQLPVLVLTADRDAELKGPPESIAGCLAKPVNLVDLLRAVAMLTTGPVAWQDSP
jgi:CheY-like chemotaxis protein